MDEEPEPSTLSYATPELEDRFHPITLNLFGFVGLLFLIALLWSNYISIKPNRRINSPICGVSSCGPLPLQLDIYHTHMGHYPASLNDLTTTPTSDDQARWGEPYIKDNNSLMDPWGRPLRYRFPSTRDKEIYDLWSAGPDGIDDTDDDIINYPKI
jgi:Type II secretion system (T2SS), protein G